jgi:hypothetical protein
VIRFGFGVACAAFVVACGSSGNDIDGTNDGSGGSGLSGNGGLPTAGSSGSSTRGGGAGIAGAGVGGSGVSGSAGASTGQAGGGMTGAGSGGQPGGATSSGGAGSGGAAGSGAGGSGGSTGSAGGAGKGGAGGGAGNPSWCQVGPVPATLRQSWDVDPFYQKYADANGIPILTSNAPPDNTLVLACQLVLEMVSMRDDVRLALIDNQVHFAIVGVNELTNDIPEYSYMPDSINTRARGLGGNPGLCAEESILCGPTDRWRGESICVHEFAHTISLYGLYDADPTFEDRLIDAYEAARAAGRFTNTYAMENEQEYWGEGVQDWYYTNLESATPNGVHGPIDKREELQAYDPVLYDLIGEFLSPNVSWDDCYRDG